MASDQWRKQLNNTSSMVPCNGREQSRTKRKISALSQLDSNLRSHVSLEWDGNQKRVVARRDQIGISWRDVRPYLASSPSSSNIVADVFSVPQEIYGLENLQDVLSYEVWESFLSESGKNHLSQFLPRGLEIEQVLQSLLDGNNFHFGNPFLNWGSRVCSGDYHPDAIREKDQHLKIEKKAYCTELHKYHNNMIGSLLKLKEKFERSKDSEGDVLQKTRNLETDMDRRISSSSNIPRLHLSEDNIEASSESYSSDADEKLSSSDNQNFSTVKGGEHQNRGCKKGSLKDNSGNPSLVLAEVSRRAKPRKGDKRQQQSVSCNDGSKYMSYVKISKKQLEIVKSMKQSGKSILSRSLNRVLGTVESFNVQPYEVFIEEEQKNLRDHWIRLANEALPVAYANWRGMDLQRRQLRESLEQNLNERLTKLTTEDVEDSDRNNATQDQIENKVDDRVCTPEGGDRSLSGSPQRDSEVEFSSGKEFESMDIDCEKQPEFAKSDDDANMNGAAVRTEYSESTDGGDAHLPCGADVWPTTEITHSYYDDSTASPEFDIAPPKRQVVDHDLESDLQVVGDCEKDTSFRQSDEGSFGSYSNQGRDELFQMQSLFKGEEMLMYQEPKPMGLDFESTINLLMGDNHFIPGHHAHFRDPPLPMEAREHKRESGLYVQQQDHDYSNAGRFLMAPRQEWSVDPPPPPPPQPLAMNGGDLGSWFCGDHQSRNGWSGGGGGTVRSGAVDQSLYGVLSYEPAATEQHFMPSRSYGLPGGGPTLTNHSMSNAALQPIPIPMPAPTPSHLLHHNHNHNHHHPLDYMSAAREAEEMGLQTPHHSDPMGKPYLRSWNQS